ncbi:winged helix-turn-helix domain-containing protein [Lichenicola sp.]
MQTTPDTFVFGPFRLHPERRLLLADGAAIALTPRAFDILEFLVRHND